MFRDSFEITLENTLKHYLIQGLAPGEAYNISLKTQTGTGLQEKTSRKELKEMVVTQPMPLDWIVMEADENKDDDKIAIILNAPDNHSKLKGFELQLFEVDGEKLDRSMTVRLAWDEETNRHKDITRMVLDKLGRKIEYEVRVKALCAERFDETQLSRKSIRPWFGIEKDIGMQKKSDTDWGWGKYLTSLSKEKTTRFKI